MVCMNKCILAIAVSVVAIMVPASGSADGASCPIFKPSCCTEQAPACILPSGCSCSDFEAPSSPFAKLAARKSARHRGTARSKSLSSDMTGTWRISGSVRPPGPPCIRCTIANQRGCSNSCPPAPPPSNTCTFVPTSKTFNVLARETRGRISARVDDRITLSGSRSSPTTVFMAGGAYYPEYACRANTSLTMRTLGPGGGTVFGEARVDWTCNAAGRSCYTIYSGIITKIN